MRPWMAVLYIYRLMKQVSHPRLANNSTLEWSTYCNRRHCDTSITHQEWVQWLSCYNFCTSQHFRSADLRDNPAENSGRVRAIRSRPAVRSRQEPGPGPDSGEAGKSRLWRTRALVHSLHGSRYHHEVGIEKDERILARLSARDKRWGSTRKTNPKEIQNKFWIGELGSSSVSLFPASYFSWPPDCRPWVSFWREKKDCWIEAVSQVCWINWWEMLNRRC